MNPERYSYNPNPEPKPRTEKLDKPFGEKAEEVVEQFFRDHVPGAVVRHATEQEDSGIKEKGGKKTDCIVYFNGEPGLAVQVTTDKDSRTQARKVQDMSELSFIPLKDPEDQHTYIVPRIQVFVDTTEMVGFFKNPDFSKNEEFLRHILKSAHSSLLYLIMQCDAKFPGYIVGAVQKLELIEEAALKLGRDHDSKENRILLAELARNKQLIAKKIKKLGPPN